MRVETRSADSLLQKEGGSSVGSTCRAVFFDLYSTLLYESVSNPFYDRVAAELEVNKSQWLAHYKKRKYESMEGAISGMDRRVSLSLQDAGYRIPSHDVSEVIDRHFHLFVQSINLYPDTISTLTALAGGGRPLGLISNASDHSVAIFQDLGLAAYFDSVVFSFQQRCLKPNPAIYHAGLQQLKVDPQVCLYVGDGGDDELRGARAVGLTTVLLDRSLPHTEPARADADHTVTSLAGVLDLVGHSIHSKV